ncbi:MAG TPA: BlaI/MecI/CopY family transcriptional regulator [Chthonomonadaceae bacterium]|nr:BlaI/MecI/CopY family transcriptional regulator [Chthonomonadaceae bacterium]
MEHNVTLGQAQLETLRYIQEHHPVTVRQVAEHLAVTRGLTRTTALNVMERLREKKYLTREQVGGVYQYSPSFSTPHLLRTLVRDFVTRTLGGSVEPFVAYLVEEAQLSDEEQERLQQHIQDLRQEAKAEHP